MRHNNSLFPHRVLEAVACLNDSYGYGTVQRIDLATNTAFILFPVTQRTRRIVTRKFHFRGDSVVFAGHQRVCRPGKSGK